MVLVATTAVSAAGGASWAAPAAHDARVLAASGDGFVVAQIRSGRRVAMRLRPGGRVVARLRARTEFGSKQRVAVVRTHGDRWLGVTTPALPNGRLAWIERNAATLRLARLRVAVDIDLSRRELRVYEGARLLRTTRVAVGRPGSSTPVGRFHVTDKLRGADFGAYYGCCILALSGRQSNLPRGWTGGNRLAIHGTPNPAGIGNAVSAGCLHAGARELRALMRTLPLGTPVFIHA